MLKRRGPAFALAAMVAIGSFAGWQLSNEPTRQLGYNAHANSANEKAAEYHPFNTLGEWLAYFWEWSTHDAVAFYTLVLAIFTGSLVVVSSIQIRYLRRADETARISANAAKLAAESAQASAEALPNIERSYLFIRLIEWDCEPDANFGDVAGARTHGGKLSVNRYFFENHGKTPAITHQIRVGFKRSAGALDSTEWASLPNFLSRERVVPPGGHIEMAPIEEPGWLSVAEGDLVVAGGLFIYFFGCAIYSDVLGKLTKPNSAFDSAALT